MKISVTKDDIANGKRGAAALCPIALAAERAGLCMPAAMLNTIEYHRDGTPAKDRYVAERLSCCTPPEAARFIRNFDTDSPVEPFEFEVELQK